jgi:hypothetical protein
MTLFPKIKNPFSFRTEDQRLKGKPKWKIGPIIKSSSSETTTTSTTTTTSRSKPGFITSTIDFASITTIPGNAVNRPNEVIRRIERVDDRFVGIYEIGPFGRRLLRKVEDPLAIKDRDEALERMDREKKVRKQFEMPKNARRDMEF